MRGVHPSTYQISYGIIDLDSAKSRFRTWNPWESTFVMSVQGECAIYLNVLCFAPSFQLGFPASQSNWQTKAVCKAVETHLGEWSISRYSASKHSIGKKQEKDIFGSSVQVKQPGEGSRCSMNRSLAITCYGLVRVGKHGVKVGAAKEIVKSFLLVLEALLFKDFCIPPFGGWFLFSVVKGSNPLTSGSCACFWLEV